jgi:hypothetical protein
MAGYSSAPLAQKLGIKSGTCVFTVGAPVELKAWLDPLPDGAVLTSAKPKPRSAQVVICFTQSQKDCTTRIPTLMPLMAWDGSLWMAWPKLAARKLDPRWETDLTEDYIRAHALASGLVDNKVCAISEVWSGLRLVYRLKDRELTAPKRAKARVLPR